MLNFKILLLCPWFLLVHCSQDFCTSKSQDCLSGTWNEEEYNVYKLKNITSKRDFIIKDRLDEIDATKNDNLRLALANLEDILNQFPESPRALDLQMRVYYLLYSQLSGESRLVGRVQLMKPAMKNAVRLLRMDGQAIPLQLLYSVAQFAVETSVGLKERDWSVPILKEILFGRNKDLYSEEQRREYTKLLLKEMFHHQDYAELAQIIDDTIVEFPELTAPHKFLKGIVLRYLEREKDDLYYRANVPMVYSIFQNHSEMHDLHAERNLVLDFMREVEKEVRNTGNLDQLNLIFELAVDIRMFPSRYQRPTIFLNQLMGQHVWAEKDLEDKKYQAKIKVISTNWEKIRDEVLLTLEVVQESNFTRLQKEIDVFGKVKQLILHGPHSESLPPSLCVHLPTICAILKDFKGVLNPPEVSGYVTVTILEPGTYLAPHNFDTNIYLRVQLTLEAPALSSDFPPKAGILIAEKDLGVFESGKILIYDGSFEHKVWNQLDQRIVLLNLDLEHPDMGMKARGEYITAMEYRLNKTYTGEHFIKTN